MTGILFIKTSSLGDVIHNMPAVTEVRAHRPDARIGWVVEEAYAPLVRLHPAVDDVIPVAARRWGRQWTSPSTWREIARFRREIRARNDDIVVDTQGLVKSALMASGLRGERHGYDAQSIREPLAARFYNRGHAVARTLHAVERNRRLSGLALGFEPAGAPDFGIDQLRGVQAAMSRYAVLLHATAQARKEWPEENWTALAGHIGRTMDVLLPWGDASERDRSLRIASGIVRARVPEREPLDGVARLIAGASFVVGVDTGLLHLAAALGVPLIGIFGGSDPTLTAPVGRGRIEVLGSPGTMPALSDVRAAVERLA
jgi:heptosyltransferase I